MKKKLFCFIARINKVVFPSFGKQQLDMSNAKKWQLAIIGFRAYITKRAL